MKKPEKVKVLSAVTSKRNAVNLAKAYWQITKSPLPAVVVYLDQQKKPQVFFPLTNLSDNMAEIFTPLVAGTYASFMVSVNLKLGTVEGYDSILELARYLKIPLGHMVVLENDGAVKS